MRPASVKPLHAPTTEEKDAVLIADNNAFIRKVLQRVLQNDYTLFLAGSAAEAAEALRGRDIKAVVCNQFLPGQTGLDFLRALHQSNPQIKCVLFSAALETGPFIHAINEGQVFRFIKKPASPVDIQFAVREAVRQYDIEDLQTLVLNNQKDIDKQMYGTLTPYWIYRLRIIAQRSFHRGAPLFGSLLSFFLTLGVIALCVLIGIMLIIYFVKSVLDIELPSSLFTSR
jgi:DNA-binding NtrC family response regulator